MADPWMKFYPTDWRSDPALRMCGLSARGLWIEMIALMHEAVPYGHLLVSGRSPTDAQLAVLVGTSSGQVPELIGELEGAGVLSRTKEGVIYSRKMTRTAKKTAIARKNGKLGGNPTLGKYTENRPSDKGQDNVCLKTQKPEARSHIVDEVGKPTSWPFSRFWVAWPVKTAKAAAEKAWQKLREPDRQAATELCADWFAAWRERNPTASPIHPASFLNARRWEDEPFTGGNFDRRTVNIIPVSQGPKRPDPALEQIARLAGVGSHGH